MIGSIAALLLSASTAAAGCPSDEPAWLELALIASEPAESEPMQRIQVHADGCVSVAFPRVSVRAGTYTMRLTGVELADLAATVRTEGVDRFEHTAIRAAVEADEAALRAAPRPGQPEVSAVICGNTHRVILREDGRERVTSWYGLDHDAARHPTVVELVAFKRFVDRIGILAQDKRLVREAAARVEP
jgi:hypothetical protein